MCIIGVLRNALGCKCVEESISVYYWFVDRIRLACSNQRMRSV